LVCIKKEVPRGDNKKFEESLIRRGEEEGLSRERNLQLGGGKEGIKNKIELNPEKGECKGEKR